MQRFRQSRHLRAPVHRVVLALSAIALLSGCGVWHMINPPPPPPPPLDPEAQSNAILTCEQIAVERTGIADSLRQISGQPTPPAEEIARLNRLEGRLAQLAANKRCPAPIPPQ